MESNPKIEKFIYDCFHKRTAALKLELEIHRAYRSRFYHDGCSRDSRHGVVERSEAETIVKISTTEVGFDVVTTGSINRLRYHVKSSGNDLLIQDVDMECVLCNKKGIDTSCMLCGGQGWLNAQRRAILLERQQLGTVATYSLSEKELEDRLSHYKTIKQFMGEHFRERTATKKREVEIHAAYRKHFYSPECEWDSNKRSVQWCEAERIVNVMPFDTGVYVITEGFSPLRSRYHLRPKGQSWLIWKVDMECPSCNQRGKRSNCLFCAGTGWTKGNDKERGG